MFTNIARHILDHGGPDCFHRRAYVAAHVCSSKDHLGRAIIP
jgi:hypothetical protein